MKLINKWASHCGNNALQVLVALLCLSVVDGKGGGRGGGGSRGFGGGGSRYGGSSGSGNSYYGGRSKYSGSGGSGNSYGGGGSKYGGNSWGNSYSRQYGDASYSRNYGGYSGYRTSSLNGFGSETIGGISVAGKTLPVYEVRVEKGCGTKSEFMKNVKKEENKYSKSKNEFCWNTNLMNGKMEKDTSRSTGYRILGEIEFCDSKQPSICESKTASNSTSGKLVFDVDLKERLFNGVGDVNYNGYRSELPVKMQREDCYCDWRYCNGCDKVRLKFYFMAISVLCKFIL